MRRIFRPTSTHCVSLRGREERGREMDSAVRLKTMRFGSWHRSTRSFSKLSTLATAEARWRRTQMCFFHGSVHRYSRESFSRLGEGRKKKAEALTFVVVGGTCGFSAYSSTVVRGLFREENTQGVHS